MALEIKSSTGCENLYAETDNVLEYYTTLINLIGLTMDKENRLSGKQTYFLAHCCKFKQEGGNISNMAALSRYFLNNEYLNGRQQIRNYKNKIGVAKWAKTGYNIFEIIPRPLASPPGAFSLKIGYGEKEEE